MGTRADFYIDREGLKWLGSIAYDGHLDAQPFGFDLPEATTEREFRDGVNRMIAELDHGTDPSEHGWPWPWDDSTSSDRAYVWYNGALYFARFGENWRVVASEKAREFDGDRSDFYDAVTDEPGEDFEPPEFPDMSEIKEPAARTGRDSVMLIG